MQWFLWGAVIVVLGLAALVAAGRFGGMPATAARDSPVPEFPADRDLNGTDLRRVRFAVTARGYSMAQVDDLLDRLSVQLGEASAPVGPTPRGATGGAPGAGSIGEHALTSSASPSPLAGSAIMDADVSQQAGEEGEYGSNEAPHG